MNIHSDRLQDFVVTNTPLDPAEAERCIRFVTRSVMPDDPAGEIADVEQEKDRLAEALEASADVSKAEAQSVLDAIVEFLNRDDLEAELDEASLPGVELVEAADEPTSHDPERRHETIQENIELWRRIFQDGIAHQIGLARDPEYRYPSQDFVEQDGEQVRTLVYVQPEPWWYEEDDGFYLRLNFGERTFALPGKNPIIHVGPKAQLLPVLEELHILAGKGALDGTIEKMVIVSR